MISGIMRDRKQTTSHNSLTTKEVSESLLSSLMPAKVIDGNEGLVDGVINAIKAVFKKIVEGLKWLWDKLFGSGGELHSFKKGLKELKGAKLTTNGLKVNRQLLYSVKREHWGNVQDMLTDLLDTANQLTGMAGTVKSKMIAYAGLPIIETAWSDGRGNKQAKIEETFVFGPNLTIKFHYDQKDGTDDVTIDRADVTKEEVEKNGSFFYMTRHIFEILVRQLIHISESIETSEKAFKECTKVWETHFKNFIYTDKFKTQLNENLEALNKQQVIESAHYLNVEFKLIKTLWLNFTKEIEEFKSLVESFTEK